MHHLRIVVLLGVVLTLGWTQDVQAATASATASAVLLPAWTTQPALCHVIVIDPAVPTATGGKWGNADFTPGSPVSTMQGIAIGVTQCSGSSVASPSGASYAMSYSWSSTLRLVNENSNAANYWDAPFTFSHSHELSARVNSELESASAEYLIEIWDLDRDQVISGFKYDRKIVAGDDPVDFSDELHTTFRVLGSETMNIAIWVEIRTDTAAAPEPAVMSLLGLGGVAILRHRRKGWAHRISG